LGRIIPLKAILGTMKKKGRGKRGGGGIGVRRVTFKKRIRRPAGEKNEGRGGTKFCDGGWVGAKTKRKITGPTLRARITKNKKKERREKTRRNAYKKGKKGTLVKSG